MDVKLLDSTEASVEALGKLFRWADSVDVTYAWAGAKQGKAEHWKALSLDKIGRALIGTQFAQTEPWVLETLQASPCELKVMLDSEGTFHPKLAIGRRKDGSVRVLMGSSNLTVGGFGANTELNVLLDADKRDPQIKKVLDFFDACWSRGQSLDFDPGWLDRYKAAHGRRPNPVGLVPMAPWRLDGPSSLEMDWDAYVEMIRDQIGRPIGPTFRMAITGPKPSYQFEFEGAARAFAGGRSFEALSLEERKFVMGTDASSGLLGNMSAAGDAKGLAYRHPESIAPWLDKIPLQGDVSSVLQEVMEGLVALHGISVGVASRLLVAKRPDLFVSVNNGSRTRLIEVFGRNITTVRHYLNFLDVVWATEWFRSARPEDAGERFIWDHRAALLDAALYEAV
jgi:hypothetical protein